MNMETFTKKTTILFSPSLHQRLTKLAEQKRTSLGELVQSACESEYPGRPEKAAAARRMKRESVADAGNLAP
jgi:hypothetical protein